MQKTNYYQRLSRIQIYKKTFKRNKDFERKNQNGNSKKKSKSIYHDHKHKLKTQARSKNFCEFTDKVHTK